MKKLYYQLTDKQIETINEHAKKYPTITADAVEALKSHYVITQVSLGVAFNINGIFSDKGFDFSFLCELFQNE